MGEMRIRASIKSKTLYSKKNTKKILFYLIDSLPCCHRSCLTEMYSIIIAHVAISWEYMSAILRTFSWGQNIQRSRKLFKGLGFLFDLMFTCKYRILVWTLIVVDTILDNLQSFWGFWAPRMQQIGPQISHGSCLMGALLDFDAGFEKNKI